MTPAMTITLDLDPDILALQDLEETVAQEIFTTLAYYLLCDALHEYE